MLISYLSIPIMMLSSVPQVIMLIKTKDSSGVSVSMFYLTFLAVFLLFIEAIRINSIVLMCADSMSLLMMFINIILIHKYKGKAQ